MGAFTCQFGVVHKTCRCPTPHTIVCDKPAEHEPLPIPFKGNATCLVWEMKNDGRLPKGKHEDHAPHDWWYTSCGGGHQMDSEPKPGDPDRSHSAKWHCPGRCDDADIQNSF